MGPMEAPEGLGWLHPRLDELFDRYQVLRVTDEPVVAFERSLAEVLDDEQYDRVQTFFDGERDSVYGAGAGELGRARLEAEFEARYAP
jgi:hypothetical protein